MRSTVRSPLVALALVLALAGTALATGASGLSPTTFSRGTVNDRVHFNTGAIKFQTKEATDLVTQTITFGAPSTSGWHAHPGVVLVTVASGSLVRYDESCAATVYPTGSAFVESGDHAGLVRNESSTTPAIVYVTYIVSAGTTALRIDKPNPGCSQS